MNDNDEIKDFTPPSRNIRFRVNDDIFHAFSELPALTLMDFAIAGERFEAAPADERRALMREMFELILQPESAQLFYERLSAKPGDGIVPIGIGTMQAVIPWVMEQYGLRPTAPSPSSFPGPEGLGSGTSLTVVAPVTELTSAP